MLNQGKHNLTCSPANSSNRKPCRSYLRGAASRRCTQAYLLSHSEEEETPRTRRRMAAARKSAEQPITKPEKEGTLGGGRRQVWMQERCAGRSLRSPMEWRQSTSSPIFSSPISSLSSEFCCDSQVSAGANLSFATANQSFRIMCNDGKVAAEETELREGHRNHRKPAKNPISVREHGGGGSGWRRTKIGKPHQNERRVSFRASNFKEESKLWTVGEDEDEDRERRKSLRHRSVPHFLSSDDDGSSGGSNLSGKVDDDSRVHRRKTESRLRCRPICTTAAETRMNEAQNPLILWKQAKTMRLMNKLKEEEARIEAREKAAAARARMEMADLEAKLEKSRETAMEKMQRKIELARNDAESKKARERGAVSRRIAKVSASFEKMTLNGKGPAWKLLFRPPWKLHFL